MDKKFVIQLTVLLLVIFGGLLSVFKPSLFGLPSVVPGGGFPGADTTSSQELMTEQILFIDAQSTGSPEIVKSALIAEIADVPEERAQGLSNRESLGENNGMMFVFPQSDQYNFIMRGMQFPLDFIWVQDDTVVDILENVMPDPAGTPDNSLKRYAPVSPVNRVIEVNSGYVQKYSIRVGDKIRVTAVPTDNPAADTNTLYDPAQLSN